MLRAPAVAFLISVLQFAVIMIAAFATGLIYHVSVYGDHGPYPAFAAAGLLAGLAYVVPVLLRREHGWYEATANRRTISEVCRDWSIAFVIVMLIAFVTKTSDMLSRGFMLLFFVAGLLGLCALEIALGRAIRAAIVAHRAAPRRILVLGDEAQVTAVARRLSRHEGVTVAAVRPLPVASTDCNAPTPDLSRDEDEELCALIERSVSEARLLQVDDVVLSLPLSRLDIVKRCVRAYAMSPITIHLGDSALHDQFAGLRVSQVGDLKTLRLSLPPLSPLQAALKRLSDIILSSVALVLLAPFLPIVAALIKWDSRGPVFFLQNRRGYNQRDFRIVKFRTMTVMDDGDVVVQARKNDPRITRIGALLRRFNIDELPQLINVLKGDMSIVGPRPHAISHDAAFEKRIARYPRRLNVKPGITGWAQVNGLRGETDTDDKMAKRVEADLHYIDNWSLAFDLRIMLMTVISRKAYRNAR